MRAWFPLTCGAVSLAGLVAWAASPAASTRQNPAPGAGLSGKRLVVAYSTEQNGYLTPCGCSAPMLGGIPRRATWLRSLAAEDALVALDNGDLTEALGRQDELKAETIVEMDSTLGCGAINLGEKDFRLGVPYLLSLQARFKGALLCANVLGQDGKPLFAETAEIARQVAGKPVKIAVAGVLSEQLATPITALNPDLKVQPAAEALARIAPALASADARILLFHGPKSEAADLAKQFPAFQLVVCAHEGDHPMEPARVGDALVVNSGRDGKYGERAVFAGGPVFRAAEAKAVPLGPELADDPRMMALKQAYLDRVVAEDLLGKVPKVALAEGERFAGSESCAGCHAEAYRVWKGSGHAHALDTLAGVKQDRDPECVQCHVVGLNRKTGFEDRARTPGLGHVGCESCHGAAGRHAAAPASAKLPKIGPEACFGCHNPQNSPRFDFAAYWPKVRH
jgi:hypothetical protein